MSEIKPLPRIELLRGRITYYPRRIDNDGLVDYLPDDYTGRVALVPCGACNGWGGDHDQPTCLSCNGKGYYFTLPFDNCEICRGAYLGVPGNENRLPSVTDPRGYIVACDYCSARNSSTPSSASVDATRNIIPPDGWPEKFQHLRGEEREMAIHRYDCPRAWDFWHKYALGSKGTPSCFGCGRQTHERGIQHLELPDIYLCKTCLDSIKHFRSGVQDGWRPISEAGKGQYILYFPEKHGRNALGEMIQVGRVGDYPFRPPTHFIEIPSAPTPNGDE